MTVTLSELRVWLKMPEGDDATVSTDAVTQSDGVRRNNALTCLCVQAVGMIRRSLHLHLNGHRTGDICAVTTPSLPVVHATHVHDVIVDPPAQQAVGQRREESQVIGESVSGEDVKVRVTGHGEEGPRCAMIIQYSLRKANNNSQIITAVFYFCDYTLLPVLHLFYCETAHLDLVSRLQFVQLDTSVSHVQTPYQANKTLMQGNRTIPLTEYHKT